MNFLAHFFLKTKEALLGINLVLVIACCFAVYFIYDRFFSSPHEPVYAHIHRLDAKTYIPDPGYVWISKLHFAVISQDPEIRTNSEPVKWCPGISCMFFPHIYADNQEGNWISKPGYCFTTTNSLRVAWIPGSDYPGRLHIFAANQEGHWRAEPGYQFITTNKLDVFWVPGSSNSYYPHVFASNTEGIWLTESGYDWLNNTPGDFRVRENYSKLGSMISKIALAFATYQYSQLRDGDGFIRAGTRGGSGKISEMLIDSFWKDAGIK